MRKYNSLHQTCFPGLSFDHQWHESQVLPSAGRSDFPISGAVSGFVFLLVLMHGSLDYF